MDETRSLLAAAREAFDAQDFAASLTALVTAWRRWPNALVADVIEKVGERVDATLEARDWDVGRFDTASLPRLLSWLSTQPPGASANTALKQLPELALPDPRVTVPLLALLGRFKDTDSAALVEAALVRNRDPRILELGTTVAPALRTRLSKMLPPPPADDDEAMRLVRGLRAVCLGDTELAATRAQHLAQLVAHPDDPVAVAVVGDWLTTIGDPLGELINLQLARGAGPASKREQQLLQQYGPEWSQLFLGSGITSATFAGGVPTGVSCSYSSPRIGPGWRAIRHLFAPHRPDWPVLKQLLSELETLAQVDMDDLETVVALDPLRKLRRLGLLTGEERLGAQRLKVLRVAQVMPLLSSATAKVIEEDLPVVLSSRLVELPDLELRNSQWVVSVKPGEPTTLEFLKDGFRKKVPTKRDVKSVKHVIKLISAQWPDVKVKMWTVLRQAIA